MNFKQVFSSRISDKEKFKKDVTVHSLKHSEGLESFYIDVRLKFVDDKGVERFTKKGVSLLPSDIKDLLPLWLFGNEHRFSDESKKSTFRTVDFKPLSEKAFLFEIKVIKSRHNDDQLIEYKESSITLTMRELEELNRIKNVILNKCNLSVE